MKALILVLGLVSSTAFATVSNTKVDCVNKDGSVTLKAELPGDVDTAIVKATVKPKNGGIAPNVEIYSRWNQAQLKQETNGQIASVDGLQNGVFTIKATSSEGAELIELYAYPSAVRTGKGLHGMTARFIGKLTLSSENGMEIANVRCTVK